MKQGDKKHGRADREGPKEARRTGEPEREPPHSYAVEVPDGLLESAEESVARPARPAPVSEEVPIVDDEGTAVAESAASALVREIDRLKAENERLASELDEMKDRALRTAAELENYRKRVLREKEDFHKFAGEGVLRDFLPVADHVDAAIAHMEEPSDLGTLREGVEITYRGLLDVLRKKGVTPFDSKGAPFDPNVHEAVQMDLSDEIPPGCIVREVRRGYMLHDRLLRPALVVVSTGKAAPEAAVDKKTETRDDNGTPVPSCEE